jgi:hypothetical protein
MMAQVISQKPCRTALKGGKSRNRFLSKLTNQIGECQKRIRTGTCLRAACDARALAARLQPLERVGSKKRIAA